MLPGATVRRARDTQRSASQTSKDGVQKLLASGFVPLPGRVEACVVFGVVFAIRATRMSLYTATRAISV
jgi:hypothetical protein